MECSVCSSRLRPKCAISDDVSACDVDRFNRFFHAMLRRGVYLAPSAFEAGFVRRRDDERIAATLSAADEALAEVTSDGAVTTFTRSATRSLDMEIQRATTDSCEVIGSTRAT